MPPMTTAEKAALRAKAQTLKPAVQVGRDGVTPAVIKELDIALKRTELVKVRFAEGRDVLRTQAETLAAATQSECAGSVGRVGVFFRVKVG